MNNIHLSIIIPVYNVEDYLAQCLDSVFLGQNLDRCEVICVNDGSTDGSRNILSQYKEKYPDLIIIDQENGGLSAARNSGLEIAKGDYIYFLDSDDYMYPDVLNKMLFFAKKQNLDLCLYNALKNCREIVFKMTTPIIGVLSGIEFYKQCYVLNNFFPPPSIWLYLYERKFLCANNLIFKYGIVHEDEEFTPRAFHFAKRVSYLDICIQYHRKLREGSLTASTLLDFNKKHVLDLIETSSNLCSFFSDDKVEVKKAFFLKIFENYLGMARLICKHDVKSKKELFSKNHFKNMRKCALGWKRYLQYFLFRYHTGLFVWYENSHKPKFLRTGINYIAIIFYKCFFNSNKNENVK